MPFRHAASASDIVDCTASSNNTAATCIGLTRRVSFDTRLEMRSSSWRVFSVIDTLRWTTQSGSLGLPGRCPRPGSSRSRSTSPSFLTRRTSLDVAGTSISDSRERSHCRIFGLSGQKVTHILVFWPRIRCTSARRCVVFGTER